MEFWGNLTADKIISTGDPRIMRILVMRIHFTRAVSWLISIENWKSKYLEDP